MMTAANKKMGTFLRNPSPINDASWTHYLPASMHELRAEVLEGDWDARGTFISTLEGRAPFGEKDLITWALTQSEHSLLYSGQQTSYS